MPPDQDGSFTAQDDERWWDQVDLTKLILAANQIKEIPDDVRLLTALAILDVSKWLHLSNWLQVHAVVQLLAVTQNLGHFSRLVHNVQQQLVPGWSLLALLKGSTIRLTT